MCAFSASAFAYDYQETKYFYDIENSRAYLYADISDYETFGRVEIQPSAVNDQTLGIDFGYVYSDGVSYYGDSDNADETAYPYLVAQFAPPAGNFMVSADYTYSVSFTTLSHEFLEYYSGPVHIDNIRN